MRGAMVLRYPLSYQDVVDLLAERGMNVDRSTVFRRVEKFGPELTKRGHIQNKLKGVQGEVAFIDKFFETA